MYNCPNFIVWDLFWRHIQITTAGWTNTVFFHHTIWIPCKIDDSNQNLFSSLCWMSNESIKMSMNFCSRFKIQHLYFCCPFCFEDGRILSLFICQRSFYWLDFSNEKSNLTIYFLKNISEILLRLCAAVFIFHQNLVYR